MHTTYSVTTYSVNQIHVNEASVYECNVPGSSAREPVQHAPTVSNNGSRSRMPRVRFLNSRVLLVVRAAVTVDIRYFCHIHHKSSEDACVTIRFPERVISPHFSGNEISGSLTGLLKHQLQKHARDNPSSFDGCSNSMTMK